jgi:hypothetical protein
MPPSRLPRASANIVQSSGTKGGLGHKYMPAQSSNGTAGRKSAAPRLSRERRHLLKILAGSGHIGVTEAIMMAYGFSTAMLAGMACDGFVAVVVDMVRAGDRTIKVRRLRITDAGRKAIED